MKQRTSHSFSIGIASTLATLATPAMAHTSDAVGFWHLVSGVDHLSVLIAVGLVFGFLVRLVNR